MLDLLQDDIAIEYENHVLIENTHFMNVLTSAYHERTQYPSAKSFRWIRKHGQHLATGQKTHLATVINKSNVHWVALIIDFKQCRILYGDSAGQPIDKKISCVLE
jgi:Ulp1 family protease